MSTKNLVLVILIIVIVIAAVLIFVYPQKPVDHKQIIDSARDYGIIMGEQPDMIESLADISPLVEGEIMITRGVKHLVPLDKIIGGGPPKDGIPSIDKPKFVSVTEADKYLVDDKAGVFLEIESQKKYYPFQILVWHEIVNDLIGQTPVLVTYCPLCGSGIVFSPIINGQRVEFGTSGKLYNSNLVMYDRLTDSYWPQITGQAMVGPLTGTKLEIIPSTVIFWDDLKKQHSDAKVLSRDTGFLRNYTVDPYGDYYTSRTVFFPVDNTDDRLHPKAEVAGLELDNQFKAYSFDKIKQEIIFNDSFAETNLLVLADPKDKGVKIFNRQVNGQILEFEYKNNQLKDKQTNSTWDFQGKATEGSLKDKQLEEIGYFHNFWFSWVAVHPETELYK